MKPERNAPCSCGSGKKHKKCCGLTNNQNRIKPDYFGINKAVAYKGTIGKQREAFCVEYAALKSIKMREIQNKLNEVVSSTGETVSCSRGCNHCCAQYVVASLQECECIAYYLYHHDKALDNFIQAFVGWKDRVLKIERCFRKIDNLGEKIILGRATDEERRIFKQESRVYGRQNNPCPFLADGACSIYEVRPYVCAGYFSVSPPDWCQPLHPSNSQAIHVKISLQLGRDMPYFAHPKSNRVYSCLPLLVHRILEEGYGALSSVSGLENLKDEVLSDPQILAALRDAGAV